MPFSASITALCSSEESEERVLASFNRSRLMRLLAARFRIFRAHRVGAAFQGGVERMPGERRALDAHGEFLDALQHRQLADLAGLARVGDQLVHVAEQGFRLFHALALDCLGHERGGGGGNGAAGALETGVDDAAVFYLQVHGELVAAQRVVAVGVMIGALRAFGVIARIAVVVEDHLLVERTDVHVHHASSGGNLAATQLLSACFRSASSITSSTASANAWTSMARAWASSSPRERR